MKDHFDGKSDTDGTVISTYTVEKWTSNGVSFTGKAVKLPVKAVFTGTIAPQGGSIANSNVDVTIRSVTAIRGATYQLTWTDASVANSPPSGPVPASGSSPTSPKPTESQLPPALSPEVQALVAESQAAQAQLIAQAQEQASLRQAQAEAGLRGKGQRPPVHKNFSAEEAASHLRYRAVPIYPKIYRDKESNRPLPTELRATYRVVIGLDGKVNDMKLIRSGMGTSDSDMGTWDSDAAREPVMSSVYDPFFQDGKPVECVTEIDFKYTFHCSDPQDPSTCK